MNKTWDRDNNRIVIGNPPAYEPPASPERNTFRVNYEPLSPNDALGWFIVRMIAPVLLFVVWLFAAPVVWWINRGDPFTQGLVLPFTFTLLLLLAGLGWSVAHSVWEQTRDYHVAAYNRMLPDATPAVNVVPAPQFAAPTLTETDRKFAKLCYLLSRAHAGDATIVRHDTFGERRYLTVPVTGDKVDQDEQKKLQGELKAMGFLVGGKGQKWEIAPLWASRPLDSALTALQDLYQAADWQRRGSNDKKAWQ